MTLESKSELQLRSPDKLTAIEEFGRIKGCSNVFNKKKTGHSKHLFKTVLKQKNSKN